MPYKRRARAAPPWCRLPELSVPVRIVRELSRLARTRLNSRYRRRSRRPDVIEQLIPQREGVIFRVSVAEQHVHVSLGVDARDRALLELVMPHRGRLVDVAVLVPIPIAADDLVRRVLELTRFHRNVRHRTVNQRTGEIVRI